MIPERDMDGFLRSTEAERATERDAARRRREELLRQLVDMLREDGFDVGMDSDGIERIRTELEQGGDDDLTVLGAARELHERALYHLEKDRELVDRVMETAKAELAGLQHASPEQLASARRVFQTAVQEGASRQGAAILAISKLGFGSVPLLTQAIQQWICSQREVEYYDDFLRKGGDRKDLKTFVFPMGEPMQEAWAAARATALALVPNWEALLSGEEA